MLLSFNRAKKAQGLVEYALILIIVAAAVVLVAWLLGPTIGNMFSNVVENV